MDLVSGYLLTAPLRGQAMRCALRLSAGRRRRGRQASIFPLPGSALLPCTCVAVTSTRACRTHMSHTRPGWPRRVPSSVNVLSSCHRTTRQRTNILGSWPEPGAVYIRYRPMHLPWMRLGNTMTAAAVPLMRCSAARRCVRDATRGWCFLRRCSLWRRAQPPLWVLSARIGDGCCSLWRSHRAMTASIAACGAQMPLAAKWRR